MLLSMIYLRHLYMHLGIVCLFVVVNVIDWIYTISIRYQHLVLVLVLVLALSLALSALLLFILKFYHSLLLSFMLLIKWFISLHMCHLDVLLHVPLLFARSFVCSFARSNVIRKRRKKKKVPKKVYSCICYNTGRERERAWSMEHASPERKRDEWRVCCRYWRSFGTPATTAAAAIDTRSIA